MESERLARIEEKLDALIMHGKDKEERIRNLEKNQTKILTWAMGMAAVIPVVLKSITDKIPFIN